MTKRLAAAGGGVDDVGDGELARRGPSVDRAGGLGRRYAAAYRFYHRGGVLGGVNMRTCIYVAGILGLAITVTQTGIGSTVGEGLLHIMPLDADRPFTSFWR